MADTKISALPAAAALSGTEKIPAVQSGGNVELTPAQIATYLGVSSGTYTPTATHITNVTASTPGTFQWMRVGNVVTVSGAPTIQATGAGAVEIEFSLPIASNFGTLSDCGGTGSNGSVTGRVSAEITNNRMEFAYVATGGLSLAYSMSFTYLIVP